MKPFNRMLGVKLHSMGIVEVREEERERKRMCFYVRNDRETKKEIKCVDYCVVLRFVVWPSYLLTETNHTRMGQNYGARLCY